MNITVSKEVCVSGNQVVINGQKLPPVPSSGHNVTIMNGKAFIDGYEFKKGKWRKTWRALWHLWF